MHAISRRKALQTLGLGTASLLTTGLSRCSKDIKNKRHIITLSFDDGFKKSSIKTAEIFEKYKLQACINVIATAHHSDFVLPNDWHDFEVGNFGLWNELQARGHEIMPHSLKHTNLKETPLEAAKDLIKACLDYFSQHLQNFDPKNAIFNFPYNASSPELEEWLATQVKAYRRGGSAINPLPHKGQQLLTCTSYGPDNIDQHLEETINRLLEQESGWLIYNTHGLDEEGWGPLSADFLESLLERLLAIESVAILPAGVALKSFA